MKITLLFYKDEALLINVDLVSGGYLLPSTTVLKASDMELKNTIKKQYGVDIAEFDLIKIPNKEEFYLFIGEWEGYFSSRDETIRNKWININEFKLNNLSYIRSLYCDIVDKTGATIGIAKFKEAEKYALRHRIILKKKDGEIINFLDEKMPFILGENLKSACERLQLNKKDYAIKEQDYSKEKVNYYIYLLTKK